MKVRVKKSVLQKFIAKMMEENWTGQEAMPTVINEPPMEAEPVVIEPSTDTQVADTSLPVDDDDWAPGNLQQLGMALKQLAESVPEGQIGYFWPRAKLLVDKARKNVEGDGWMASATGMDVDPEPEPETEEQQDEYY